jgi:hypothetical protein
MRGKKLGYQIGAEETFAVELEVVSQAVDLLGEEDSRDRAAGPAVFTRPEILFEILVNTPSGIRSNRPRETEVIIPHIKQRIQG